MLHYVVHVLLIDSFLAQRGNFFPRKSLDQLEISTFTECELKRFSGPSVKALPHPSRVSLRRARSLFHPLLPSACYAGYLYFDSPYGLAKIRRAS